MKTEKLLLIIILVLCVAGCGGGGGGTITGDPVWNARIGVVAESTMKSFSTTAAVSTMVPMDGFIFKALLAVEPFIFKTDEEFSSTCFKTSDINQGVWDTSTKFIFLDWASLNGATYYQVYFLGTDGSQNQKVWDSQDEHPNDPVYTTKAFLDLSDELAGLVTVAGRYQFKVIAYNSRDSKEFPAVTVSIGKILSNTPSNLVSIPAAKTLSWAAVAEAGGYKAAIYSDAALQTRVWDSGTDLIETTSVTFGVLTPGDYHWIIMAYANENGKTAEITYAMSAFTVD